ncbi:MAG: hypothetical protein KDE22_17235 [Rhodobacterales bacterium]|nr:hypothetical protein [Rhodobacterales bacterium]
MFDTDSDAAAYRDLRDLARRRYHRAERLIESLEAFVARNTDQSSRVVPDSSGPVEIYLEPPLWVLHGHPDAAALVRVDHLTQRITLVHVLEEYGGPGADTAQWARLRHLAEAAL